MPKATKCGQCRYSIKAEKIHNLARSIIADFVIALIMPIGALVCSDKLNNNYLVNCKCYAGKSQLGHREINVVPVRKYH